MALVPIRLAGQYGIIQDLPPYELPPEAWSSGLNVRTRSGSVQKVFGYESIYGTPTAAPVWLMPAFTEVNDFIAYGAIGALYATDGVSHGTLRTALGGVRDDRWNGGMFGGIGIMNNGISDPQEWNPPGLATATVDLTNWPANTLCKVMRPYGRFLVAYYVSESGTDYPQRIKWSSSAAVGSVPASWDETDPSNDSGEWELSESWGAIIDAKSLGPINFIYKEDSVHAMQYTAGQFVFRFDKRFNFGILAQDCVVEDERRHYVGTRDDFVVHDGFETQGLLSDRMKRWYSGRPDDTNYTRSYLVKCENEFWLCFPEAGESEPNIALVYNKKTGAVTIRDIPDLPFITVARVDSSPAGTTFDSQTIPFDTVVGQFGQRNFAAGTDRCVGANNAGPGAIELMDSGFDLDGAGSYRAFIERTGLAVAGVDRNRAPFVDQTAVKHVTQVWPKARLQNGTQLEVYVGSSETPEGTVTWSPQLLWDPSVAPYVDCDVVGPYIAVRFETNDDTHWKLDEYSLELNVVGRTAA